MREKEKGDEKFAIQSAMSLPIIDNSTICDTWENKKKKYDRITDI
jgi:hypothetical protein